MSAASRARPPLVWLVVAVSLLGVLATWSTTALVGSGVLPVDSAARAYLAHLDRLDYAFLALCSAVLLAAAFGLFLLRRAALYLYAASLALYLVNIALYATPEREAGLGSYWNGSELFKLAFQVGAIAYCARLAKRGVLR